MDRGSKTDRKFHSLAEIEKKYLPSFSETREKKKKIANPRSLGIIIARSPIKAIEALLVDRTDILQP